MLKKIIIVLFTMIISFSNVIFIKTNLNEINIFDNKNQKIEIVEEKVQRNKNGNKEGKVYIKTKNNDVINANYIDGKLNGKLTAKNGDGILEINYEDNFKNGRFSFKLDDLHIESTYFYDVKHGNEKMKLFSNTIERSYFNGNKNGLEKIISEDKIITMNIYENNVFGKVEEIYKDGEILEYFIDDDGISGKLTLKLNGNKEIIMSVLENVQIGNAVYVDNGNKKIYDDILSLNKEIDVLKYLPESIIFLSNKRKNDKYISKLNIDGIKKEFIYNTKEGMLEGILNIKYYKDDKLVKSGSYEFKKGSIDGKINLNLENCKLNFEMKNNLREGKYIADCNYGNLIEEYKEGKIEGVSMSKDKKREIDKIIKYDNGIEIYKEIKGKDFYYKKYLVGNKWEIYEEILDSNGKLIHTGIIEGKKANHKIYINEELIDEFEGNEDDLPINFQFLKLYEYK